MTLPQSKPPVPADAPVGRRIEIRGIVQGVGMRPFVARIARATGVGGWVRNHAAGVSIEAFGRAEQVEAFLERLERERPPAACYEAVEASELAPRPETDFRIVGSEETAERRVTIPPDLPTCEDCLREMADPADRRHRYPFTNCTNCGPRFTIVREVPYDRPVTTMAGFRMCPACQAEYDSATDRRYHAQPNACPACGPRLALLTPDGRPVTGADGVPLSPDAALVEAGRALASGAIVAVKGLGGYHLACDARDQAAVLRLRVRKRRDEKPFAVMPRDLDEARRLATLTPAEIELLRRLERPIVLVRRAPGAPLAEAVAPDSPLVGLLLPYTPLHHLLLQEAGRPLVMTSANVSEEPIVHRDDEAPARLRGIADLILVHDREIESRADDSVARVVAGRPMVMRRARGYVPRPLRVQPGFARPVLACGAQLKNTFCLGRGEEALLGPHVGDLDNLETYEAYEAAIARLERFLRLTPEVVAHDLHPGYPSTRYALERARQLGVPAIAVQHHHAHVASAMVEHRLAGPVLGVAFDGTGHGPDGTAWGAELLLADLNGFERLATLRPLSLPGGEQAIREPWRAALMLLDDAFDGRPVLDDLPVFADVPAASIALMRRMAVTGFNAPAAHGAGRLFDAVGALVLGRGRSRFEGQVAMGLDNVAADGDHGAYPLDLQRASDPWQLDPRPLTRALAADLRAGLPAPVISARFHEGLARGVAQLVLEAAARHGARPVVLTGGVFQNARLAEAVAATLSTRLPVYLHGTVPPGDGGIALGQAAVADAILSSRSPTRLDPPLGGRS